MKAELPTLYAQRIRTEVHIFDKRGLLKKVYTNAGYRPTKSTKEITLGCWRYKLEWIKRNK